MLFSLNQIVLWLAHYKYWVIFPVAVVEGPIVTIIAGFLASLGQLHFITAYVVIVIADLTGDGLYYLLGRFGRHKVMVKIGNFLGVTPERTQALEKYFVKHPNKIFIAGKMVHGVGTLVLAAAGFAKVPFRKFILLNAIPTMVKSFMLLIIGFYFGEAYAHINAYLDYFAVIIAVIFIGLYFVMIKYSKKMMSQ